MLSVTKAAAALSYFVTYCAYNLKKALCLLNASANASGVKQVVKVPLKIEWKS